MGAPRDIDEQVVKRRDPRREESIPPEARKSARPQPELIPEVAPLEPVEEPEPPSRTRKLALEPQSTGRRAAVTNVDPRLEALEPLLRAGDWDGVLKELGPADQIGKLPPNLGLLYAIARKEKEGTDAKGSDATELAIRCTAGLLGVRDDSPLALVVAKRIVRKNPVAWQKAPAPRATVSALIMLVALVLGGLVGWLMATGRVHIRV